MPFILANEAFEKVASYGLLPNMILYLTDEYHMAATAGTNLLFFWNAATNLLPIVGAFLSDAFLGRFLTIGLGSICSLLGMVLLWLTAMLPWARPPPCAEAAHNCKPATDAQFAMLITSFVLVSIGAGGIRPCSMAFGADQIDKKDDPNNKNVLETFFSWYYATASLSVMIAFTGIVYVQDKLGWKLGFGIPAILMFLSAFLFWLAFRIYIKKKPHKSLFTGLVQVGVAAYRNRKLDLPSQNSDGRYHHHHGDSNLVCPTNRLRFLNKACIIRTPEQDVTPEGVASNPWTLCTVEQVEELKALLKVLPLWSTGIMMNMNPGAFSLLQVKSMDRHLTSGFEIPAGSFSMFVIIALVLWIGLYDLVLLPLASKLRGKRVSIAAKHRMGLGLFFSCVALFVSGCVEHVRRKKVIQQGLTDDAGGLVHMSAMWLVPQNAFMGIAEAFNAIGQSEFYYTEFPRSMSSIASCLLGLGMAVGSLLSSLLLTTVKDATRRGEGKEGWVSDNINKGHYDYYYWLLAFMGVINLAYFMVCSWAYGPSVEQVHDAADGKEGPVWDQRTCVGTQEASRGRCSEIR